MNVPVNTRRCLTLQTRRNTSKSSNVVSYRMALPRAFVERGS